MMISSICNSISDSVNNTQNVKPKKCKEKVKRNYTYPHNLKIIYQNIQYISNKIDQIAVFLQETAPHILAISEHGLKENEILALTIEGYLVGSYNCRKKYKGGGPALYVFNNMSQVRALDWISKNSIEKTAEVNGIVLGDMNCIIIVFYRSPKGLLDDFFNCSDCILDKITQSGKGMGDLNINILEKGAGYKQLQTHAPPRWRK
jgi:hypothetical protein